MPRGPRLPKDSLVRDVPVLFPNTIQEPKAEELERYRQAIAEYGSYAFCIDRQSDAAELTGIGEHCSKTERRADIAERELIKVKLLTYLSERLGMEMEVVITGVADYGFYGQAEKLPIEGLIHVSTLNDDYYYFEEASHSLIGSRTKRRFRLGDKVRVQVARVDIQKRQLDLRLAKRKVESRKLKNQREDDEE